MIIPEKYALIVPRSPCTGVAFLTHPEEALQLGRIAWRAGHIIEPHWHTAGTQEVLLIRSGVIRMDIYNDVQRHVGSQILREGDGVLLRTGGHGFLVLSDAELIEVKQGPFKDDKVRFKGITP